MYLHLGQDYVVHTRDIIGIFDIDSSSVAKNTRQFLRRAEEEGAVVTVSGELPKSFVVCAEPDGQRVYLRQLNSSTLLRRSEQSGIE